MFNRVHAQLAPETRTLVSAKWQRRVHQSVRIYPHRASLQPPRDAVRLLHVARPYGRRQAIGIVISLLNDFVDIVERQNRKHGTENFFPRNLHVVLYVAKNCWLYEETLAPIHRDQIS